MRHKFLIALCIAMLVVALVGYESLKSCVGEGHGGILCKAAHLVV